MSDALEAIREYMDQETANELASLETHDLLTVATLVR